MSANSKLNENALQFSNQLILDQALFDNNKTNKMVGKTLNVAGVGRVVSSAYEQLRNAAEYAQEHLLMQKAIRRFYVRNLSFQHEITIKKSVAEELIIELTQSGYINNNTQPVERVDQLKDIIQKNYKNYWRLKKSKINERESQSWVLDLLSVETEGLVAAATTETAFVQFAYRHYKMTLRKNIFTANKLEEADFEASLYVSVYRSLLKSDIAIVRYDMQQLYSVSDTKIEEYAKFHRNIDKMFYSDLTNKITHHINKYGAPLRVLKSMVRENPDMGNLLNYRERFNSAYEDQIRQEYNEARSKIRRGLLKSIVFILITKTLIGLAIEVPYDLLINGMVMMLPLIINLLTPVVYMVLLGQGIKIPNQANTDELIGYADNMFYGELGQVDLYSTAKKHQYPAIFKIIYAVMFLAVFIGVAYLLDYLGFNIVQGCIFLIFLAAASFLGFRLAKVVQELELVTVKPGIIMTIRDFIFMPFTILGKWMSEKYQKVNFVSIILDTIIELPLKTVLRLVRQWTGFVNQKKDEI